MKIPFERSKQNAPGWEPEGVRVASGDRDDRSPQAGSVDEIQVDGIRLDESRVQAPATTIREPAQPTSTHAAVALFERRDWHAGIGAIRVHDEGRKPVD